MQLTTVKLWRCPECNWITDGRSIAHGPITAQAYCQGLPVPHNRIKMDQITYVQLDQVIEQLEGLAEAVDTQGEHSLDDLACATFKQAATQIQTLATQLKESSDHE